MGDGGTAERIRCYGCGREQDAADERCGNCEAHFHELCACGRLIRFDAPTCTACGAEHQAIEFDTARAWRKVAKRAAVVVGVLGGAALVVVLSLAPEPDPALRRELGLEAFGKRDFAGARRELVAVTRASPKDAHAWFLLALSERELGVDPVAYLARARRAIENDARSVPPLVFLGREELALGRWDEAARLAERAHALSPADPDVQRLRGEVQLRRTPPDLRAAAELLRAARAGGMDGLEMRLLVAEAELLLFGEVAADARPPELSRALDEAAAALDAATEGAVPRRALDTAAQVLLVLGRRDEALVHARAAAEALPRNVASPAGGDVLFLLGRAEWMNGREAQALATFGSALRVAPEERLAVAIHEFLASRGAGAMGEQVVAERVKEGDVAGELHAGLARIHVARGDLASASTVVTTARRAWPTDPRFIVIAAEILRAQGRLEEARTLYDDAARLGAASTLPKVRAATLVVDGAGSPAERQRALERGIESLAALHATDPADPDVAAGLATLQLAAGRADEAVAVLDASLAAVPSRADLWLLLAEALERSANPRGASRSVEAFARARALRPRAPEVAARDIAALLAAGDAAGAVARATDALAHAPRTAELLRLRAAANERLARWEDVAADLRELHNLRPNDARVTERLAEIEQRTGGTLLGNPTGAELARLRVLAEQAPSGGVAEALLDAGDLPLALAVARRAVSRAPTDSRAVVVLVSALLEPENPSPASVAEAELSVRSLGSAASPGIARLLRGRILLARGAAADAVPELARAARELPEHARARFFHADALAAVNDVAGAVDSYRRALETRGASPHLAAQVALRLHALSRDAGPMRAALLQEALRVDSHCAPAAEDLVALLHERGEFAAAARLAESWARTGLDADTAHRFAHRAVLARFATGEVAGVLAGLDDLPPAPEDSAYGRLFRATSLLQSGRLDDASRGFEDLLQRRESQEPAAIALTEIAWRRNGRDEALRRADAAIAGAGEGSIDPLSIARLLACKGEFDEAIRRTRLVLAARPDSLDALRHLTRFLARAGRSDEALSEARRLLGDTPSAARGPAELVVAAIEIQCEGRADFALEVARRSETPAARVLEAEALLALGRGEESEEAAHRALASLGAGDAPLEVRCRFVLGSTAWQAGRAGDAAAELLRCVDLDPAHPAALENLAWILSRSASSTKLALTYARRAADLAPLDAGVWNTRAACAAAAGDAAEADTSWQRALSLLEGRPGAARERATIALRYAEFLASKGRADEARALATEVAGSTSDEVLRQAARRFLDGR